MKPQTHFKIKVVIGKNTPPAILRLLTLMCGHQSPELSFLMENFTLPNHPFFHLPDWHLLFNQARAHLRTGPDQTCRLTAVGRTDLEEQDIGLFLRWIQQYLSTASVFNPHETLATVRSEARPPDAMWLEYRIDKSDLTAPLQQEFVPLGNLLG